MSKYVKVVVYVPAPDAEKLRGNGITDIPTWTRDVVKERIQGMPEPPASDAPADPYNWESGT
jgi:hypothetical protein